MPDLPALPRRLIPSLSALRALEALDRLGTATAAAEELALTQSAVSRQLQHLETQLGAELIIRDKRRMHMTEIGARYAAEVRESLSRLGRAAMALHMEPGTGGLALAILPSFGMRWLVPRLAQFALLHPDVTVNLSTRLRPVNFDADPFHAAIQYGSGQWSGTQSLLLREERMVPVCAPSLVPGGPVKDAAALTDMPLLHIETRPNAWRDWLISQGAAPPARPGARFDQFSTITQAAIHGLGVALMPDFIAEPEIAQGRLARAFQGGSASLGSYYLVWPNDKSRDPALRLFRDWIATQTEDEDNLPR